MINLIPDKERMKQIGDYKKRFYVAILFASAAVWVIGLVFLVPVYLSAKDKTVSMEKSVDIAKSISSAKGGNNPEFSAKDIQGKISTLLPKEAFVKPSRFLSTMINDKPNGVKIIGFTYADKGNGSGEIEIRGVAEKREDLTRFVQVLEKEPVFQEVSVPVSSFVKDRNLDFTMRILSKQTKP